MLQKLAQGPMRGKASSVSLCTVCDSMTKLHHLHHNSSIYYFTPIISHSLMDFETIVEAVINKFPNF